MPNSSERFADNIHKIGNFPAKIPPAEPLCSTEGVFFLFIFRCYPGSAAVQLLKETDKLLHILFSKTFQYL